MRAVPRLKSPSWRAYGRGLCWLICLALGGCGAPQSWQWPARAGDQIPIAVVNHGWHTGIILRGGDIGPDLAFVSAQLGAHPFYEFGWGDAGFYQAEEIDSGLTLAALFWPTPSVMHVAAFSPLPERYFELGEVERLWVSAQGLARLQRFIAARFIRAGQQPPQPFGRGLYGRSRFYRARGEYLFTYTCNSWSAEALAQAGAPIDGRPLGAERVMRETRRVRQLLDCCDTPAWSTSPPGDLHPRP